MYAKELARILEGMPHDAQVRVLSGNGVSRTSIDHVLVMPTPTSLEVVIVPVGSRK